MSLTNKPLYAKLDEWLNRIPSGTNKRADDRGDTTHPIEDVDNNTRDSTEGARSAENTKDVKEKVPGQSVDSASARTGDDENQMDSELNATSTGNDPSVEDNYKGTKDDPGTTHPANAETLGEKYSSMKFDDLLKVASKTGNDLLTLLDPDLKKLDVIPGQKVANTKVQPTNKAQSTQDMTKVSEDVVAQIIRDADIDADLVGAYVVTKLASLQKQADDAALAQQMAQGGGGAPPMPPQQGGPPPEEEEGNEDGGDEENGKGDDQSAEDILAQLAGGGAGGAQGGGAPPPMPPPDAGVMPGQDGPPGAGGQMSQEQALQELAMALQELQMHPELLAQQGGDQGQKIASVVTNFHRSGKFTFSEAKSAKQKKARQEFKEALIDLCKGNN